MKLAGEAVARCAFDLEDHSGSSMLFLIGKGKNGDDARIAAELLTAEGVEGVQLMKLVDGTESLPDFSDVSLIVDGVFGIGLNRELSSDWCDFIERLNENTKSLCPNKQYSCFSDLRESDPKFTYIKASN